jgi:ssDNA-binding Zn-finger/Zn-ribbon topoisomerase 1
MRVMEAGAVLLENTTKINCQKCKSLIVMIRSNYKTIKTICQCPKCGTGISHIWQDGGEQGEQYDSI